VTLESKGKSDELKFEVGQFIIPFMQMWSLSLFQITFDGFDLEIKKGTRTESLISTKKPLDNPNSF
jgi:hypothetical protein